MIRSVFPGVLVVKNPPAKAGKTGSVPRWGRSCEKRKCQPSLVFLPGKSHGQRSLVGYGPWDCSESDTTHYIETK